MPTWLLYAIIIILILLLIGAVNSRPTRHKCTRSFPKSQAVAVYERTDERGVEDCLTLKLNQKGKYDFVFDITPGFEYKEGNNLKFRPHTHSVVVNDLPFTYPISQNRLPNNLRVRVYLNGETEAPIDFA